MIETRFTKAFGLDHPIASAPMSVAAGGRLAAAVTQAGGLGFIGGGYCDPDWIAEQFAEADNQAVGCGFITWRLAQTPAVLDQVLDRNPKAIFLSFSDPAPFVAAIEAASIPWIAEVQSVSHARHAAALGARAIVAQGAEAGGHSAARGTLSIVPEIADMLAREAPDTLLLAAGGIADGRGLAAALMLGADGALVGTKFWASEEALVHPNQWKAGLSASGDDTLRTKVIDIARHFDWSEAYTCRILKNAFTERWQGDLDGLIAAADREVKRFATAWANGDTDIAAPIVGEAIGLIDDIQPAGEIVQRMSAQAEALLNRGTSEPWRAN